MKTIHQQILDRMKAKGVSRSAFAARLAERKVMSRSGAMKYFAGTSDTGTANADAMFLVLAKMKRKETP